MKIVVNCISELSMVAENLISSLDGNNIICFYAKMGVGKTTFIREICLKLGVKDTVSSPTFSIVNQYFDKNQKEIYHFDLYRLNKKEELYDIGFIEYLNNDRLCLIEWPEKAEQIITDTFIKVKMIKNKEQRIIEIIK